MAKKKKSRGATIEIKFNSRQESIAFFRAIGANRMADAMEKIELAHQTAAQQAVTVDALQPGSQTIGAGGVEHKS